MAWQRLLLALRYLRSASLRRFRERGLVHGAGLFVGPADGFVRERGMKPAGVQRAFDGIDRFVLREQGQCEPAGAAARDVDGVAGLLFDPFRVPCLQPDGEAADVAAVHGREGAAHRDCRVAVGAGELELLEAGEAADERRLLTLTRAESERGRGVGDGEVDAFRAGLEPVGEVAQQQQCRRAQRRQPERLDILAILWILLPGDPLTSSG